MMARLTEHVLHLGSHYFHYYIIGNNPAVLIECGVSAGVESLKKDLQQLQMKPRITQMLAMHAHFDHVCGIPSLKNIFPGAQVAASQEAANVLDNNTIMNNFFLQDEAMSEVMISRGILENKPPPAQNDTIKVNQVIGEGHRIEIGNAMKLQILAAPGHSPCSIAAYLPNERVMFLSDAAGFQINTRDIFPIYFQDYLLYVETIKRLMSFPARVLAVPHGRIISGADVNAFYQRALEAATASYNWICSLFDSGHDSRDICPVLFDHYYQDDLRIYTPENIRTCVNLLVRRTEQARH